MSQLECGPRGLTDVEERYVEGAVEVITATAEGAQLSEHAAPIQDILLLLLNLKIGQVTCDHTLTTEGGVTYREYHIVDSEVFALTELVQTEEPGSVASELGRVTRMTLFIKSSIGTVDLVCCNEPVLRMATFSADECGVTASLFDDQGGRYGKPISLPAMSL